jgi:hypothetical protein
LLAFPHPSGKNDRPLSVELTPLGIVHVVDDRMDEKDSELSATVSTNSQESSTLNCNSKKSGGCSLIRG